jgi:hypothetical protein
MISLNARKLDIKTNTVFEAPAKWYLFSTDHGDRIRSVIPKYNFLSVLFLPSADSKAVRRRPCNPFLTPLPPPLPQTLVKSVCKKLHMTHLITNNI